MPTPRICVQTEAFDTAAELAALQAGDERIGAVASFVGLVRRVPTELANADAPQSLTIEHYPGMTERYLTQLAAQAQTRFGVHAVTIIHRVGQLLPGEGIVLIATAAPHRTAAFQACDYLMDHLSTLR